MSAPAPTPPTPPPSADAGSITQTPPKLPTGWIAQWDVTSNKYYYVQISTGVSRWELPISAAPVGSSSNSSSPAQSTNPYDKPVGTEGPEAGDGIRGVDGPTGDRGGGLGGFAMNALMGSKQRGGSYSGGSRKLVGQLRSALLSSGNSSGHSSGRHSSGGAEGPIGTLTSGPLGGGEQNHGQKSRHNASGGHEQSGGLGEIIGNKPTSDFGSINWQALKGKEKALGPEHPDTLTSVSQLGPVLSSQGKYAEAEAMYQGDLKGSEKVLGSEFLHTFTSVATLPSTYNNRGRSNGAEELEVKVMETTDERLKAIAQTVRAACVSTLNSTLHFDLPPQLLEFLQEEIRQDCDLGLISTVTGTAFGAYAGTVREYTNFAWPSAEFDLIDLLTKARRGYGCGGELINILYVRTQ